MTVKTDSSVVISGNSNVGSGSSLNFLGATFGNEDRYTIEYNLENNTLLDFGVMLA